MIMTSAGIKASQTSGACHTSASRGTMSHKLQCCTRRGCSGEHGHKYARKLIRGHGHMSVYCTPSWDAPSAPSSFILSVYPLLVGPSRTSCVQDSRCRFFPHDPVVGCLLFVAVRPLSASARSSSWTSSSTSYMLDDSNVWIVFVNWTYHYAMGTSLRRLLHFCDAVAISETSRFVMLTSPTRRWIPEQRLRRGSILLRSRGSASARVSRRPDFLRSPQGTQIRRFTYRWSSVSFLRLGSRHRSHGSPTMSSRPFP